MVKLTDEKKEAKRREILSCAKEVFAEKSFHEATLEEIAQRTNISKGTLYVYFDSKEEIFISILNDDFKHWKEIIHNLKKSDLSPPEKLKILIREELEFHLKNKSFHSIYISHRGLIKKAREFTDAHKEKFIKERDEMMEEFSRIMEDFIKDKFIIKEDPLDLSMIILGMIHGVIFKIFDRDETPNIDEVVDKIYDIFLNGVQAR